MPVRPRLRVPQDCLIDSCLGQFFYSVARMETFYHIGAAIAVFLASLVFATRHKPVGSIILGIWLTLAAANLFLHHRIVDHLESPPFLLISNFGLLFFHGPMLYLYVRTVMGSRPLPSKLIAIHLIVPLLFYAYALVSGNTGEQLYYTPLGQGQFETALIRWTAVFASLAYLLAGFFALMRKYRRLPHFFSSSQQTEPLWLFSCVGGLALSWLAFVYVWLLGHFIPFLQGQALDYGIVMFCIVIFFLGIFGIRHTPIFSDETEDEALENKDETALPKKDVMSKEDEKRYHSQLETFMANQKPYLNGKLTIRDLSRQSGIPMPVLSLMLNRGEARNFFTFVNGYRVEEFKKRMADPAYKNYTLTAIAFECGFNSKSSFYSVFKKMTGQTPSKYNPSK